MTTQPYITFSNVSKFYDTPTGPVTILEDLNLEIYREETIAIIGPSGSGKTTLLSLLAGLDRPSSGEIRVGDQVISQALDKELAHYRNTTMGIIFQSFELIVPFSVVENITAPLDIANVRNMDRVHSLLERTEMTHRADAFPATLSGGEKQRVAIARALVHSPTLILADEPTGSLDQKTGSSILDLLLSEVSREKKTLIMITHDETISHKMDRVFKISNEQLHEIS